MDLKRNQVTVGELMDHPGARAVLQRRFPMLMKHPMLGAARTITLEQILSVAQAYVPEDRRGPQRPAPGLSRPLRRPGGGGGEHTSAGCPCPPSAAAPGR